MAIKKLCTREAYTDKQGNEKVNWNQIGILFDANGKQYVKLYHIPGVLISVFEPKSNNNSGEIDL